MTGTALLVLDGAEASYGASQILFGASLAVGEGQVATLMGRNGMGKTTLIRTIMGMLPLRRGGIAFAGRSIAGWPSHRIARLGIGLVPEGRQVFPLLTVAENLRATSRGGDGTARRWTLDTVYALFPRLRERASQSSTTLSGGEQQMLAIGRALMTNPRLLILVEATEGLAPLIREEIWQCLRRLKETGMAILVVDKNLDALLALADMHFIIEKGVIVWSGDSGELSRDPALAETYLGV